MLFSFLVLAQIGLNTCAHPRFHESVRVKIEGQGVLQHNFISSDICHIPVRLDGQVQDAIAPAGFCGANWQNHWARVDVVSNAVCENDITLIKVE